MFNLVHPCSITLHVKQTLLTRLNWTDHSKNVMNACEYKFYLTCVTFCVNLFWSIGMNNYRYRETVNYTIAQQTKMQKHVNGRLIKGIFALYDCSKFLVLPLKSVTINRTKLINRKDVQINWHGQTIFWNINNTFRVKLPTAKIIINTTFTNKSNDWNRQSSRLDFLYGFNFKFLKFLIVLTISLKTTVIYYRQNKVPMQPIIYTQFV